MSSLGKIILYTTKQSRDPVNLIRRSIDVIQPERISSVTRSVGRDREWRMLRRLERAESRRPKGDVMFKSGSWYAAENPYEELHEIESSGLTAIPTAYLPRRALKADLRDCKSCTEIRTEMNETLPVAVRGQFNPEGVELTVGAHDVVDYRGPCRRLARAFFAVTVMGYGDPEDADAAIVAIPRLRAFRRLHESLERITGPLNVYMYWH